MVGVVHPCVSAMARIMTCRAPFVTSDVAYCCMLSVVGSARRFCWEPLMDVDSASGARSPRLCGEPASTRAKGRTVKFRIEPLAVEDLDRCVDVFIAAFSHPDRLPWRSEDVRVRLLDLWNEPKRVGLVATDEPDDTVVGFAIGNFVQVSDGPALRIGELCVHPSRQHYGLGSRLLLGMEGLAREHGAHSAYLTVFPESVEFCRRLGYERQDEWIAMGRRLHDLPTSASGEEPAM